MPTQNETTTIRPAEQKDIPALANLLTQLYAAELPGALTGEFEKQVRVMQFTLEAQPRQALKNRFVLCDADGRVQATGMMQLPALPDYDRAPNGTIATALRVLGYRATGQLILTIARSRVGVHSQRQMDSVLLHSVVVNESQRGQGLGLLMLETLEGLAARQGYAWATLQVLADNQSARKLYLRHGYEDIGETPRWAQTLSWKSYIMRKALTKPAL